jgi:hypothetical protein
MCPFGSEAARPRAVPPSSQPSSIGRQALLKGSGDRITISRNKDRL